jgi:23S rRNA (pseudouridine1915-N3)-methyltransferase
VKVFLYFAGKAKDVQRQCAGGEYIKRSDRYASSTMTEIPAGPRRFLDETSHREEDPARSGRQAARFEALRRNLRQGRDAGHDLVFVVGGHDGCPKRGGQAADLLVSLSAMTMPHELARAVLAEQIYRAFTILRGHPYPR